MLLIVSVLLSIKAPDIITAFETMLSDPSQAVPSDIIKAIKFNDKDKLISYIVHDKKANNNFVEMVKVNKIGTFEIENVEIEKIKEML